MLKSKTELCYNINMLISHETPIGYFNKFEQQDETLPSTRNWNNYEYALVHLFETHPDYYEYFARCVANGIEVLLDNSIFELGTSFNAAKYAKWIDKIQPTYYIVPDTLNDGIETTYQFNEWSNNQYGINGMRIGVVHGKTYIEMVECYKYMKDHADYIAFNFVDDYYKTVGWNKWNDGVLIDHKLQKIASGRQRLISQLIDDGIWDENKPHHLLGCVLAREFSYYREQGIKGIRSCDTSNPIMAALNDQTYLLEIGLNNKPDGLLADHINEKYDIDTARLMYYNTHIFKKIVNG